MKASTKFFLIFFSFLLASTSTINSPNASNGLKFSVFFSLPSYIPVPSVHGLNVSGESFYVDLENLGSPADFSISYDLYPHTENISVVSNPSKFHLDSGERKRSWVSIQVGRGTVGKFNLTIYVEGKINNVVLASSKRILVECYRGKVFHVKVYTRMFDGTPIYSRILVEIERFGERIAILEGYGPVADFYLLNRTYFFSAYIGSQKLDEKEVKVDKDGLEVYLEFSLILVKSFEVLRPPRYTTDPLIFSVKIASISDLIKKKKLTIFTIFKGSEENVTKKIGEVEINGEQEITLNGYLDPPEEWVNGTYIVDVLAVSNNRTLSKLESSINIVVYEKRLVIREGGSPIIYYAISAIMSFIGAVIGLYIGGKRSRGREIEKSYRIKRIAILGEGRPLYIYDLLESRVRLDLIEDNMYAMALSMAQSLLDVSEKLGAGQLKSYTTEKSKFILVPLEGNFRLIVETDQTTDEFDPEFSNKIKMIKDYIEVLHKKYRIESPEKIVSLFKYAEKLENLEKILKSIK